MLNRLVGMAKSAVGIDPEAAAVDAFRTMMIQALKHPPAGGVNLAEIREAAGVSAQGASRVVAELYLRFARKVADDGVITDAERTKLDRLAAVLDLPPAKARSIEQIAASQVYEETAQRAIADGVVSVGEAARLAEMRRNLLPELEDEDDEVGAELATMFDRDGFRDALARDFKAFDARRFRLSEYAAKSGAPLAVAVEVAEELYARFAAKVCSDGIVTPAERNQLDVLAKAFEVTPDWAARVEDQARREAYRRAVVETLADGVITAAEADRLASLRLSLGIAAGSAARVAGELAAEAYEALIRRVAATGRVDLGLLREVDHFKAGLGLTDADTSALIRSRAIGLYRETFAAIVHDGDVTRPQEELLAWLRAETGLSDSEVAPYARQMAELKRLAEYRAGRLPLAETRKLLEGGETCHWDSRCRLAYQTARGTIHVEGELIATSKRILFVSPTRNFSFAPWKVVDIEDLGHRVTVKAEGRQGSGDYFVERPRELAAILEGLARRGKYTAANKPVSATSRHIPGEVRRAVWARDGGRCVQCQDDQYLEFDHIIPHSRGGANRFGNVQLLCRRCNGEKGDRI